MYSPHHDPISIGGTNSVLSKSAALQASFASDDEDDCQWQKSASSLQSPLRSRNSEEGHTSWSANPQSPSNEDTTRKRGVIPRTSSFSTQARKVPYMFLLFVVAGMGAVYTAREAVHTAAEHVHLLQTNKEMLNIKLQRAQKEIHKMKRELSAMDMMMQKQQTRSVKSRSMKVANYRALHEMNSLQSRLREEAALSQTLKDKVQQKSRDEIIEKYGGTGPFRVEFKLIFPDNDHQKDGPDSFIVELAPLDIMPHSVQTFLAMVSMGLIDGCSFILNALHVIKAAPLPFDGSSAAAKARTFSDNGLESVAFKEYSDQYPHKPFTIGFAADGSPSFYINTEDNTEIHAGDPCFGTVVDGFDAIERLENSPTRNGIWFEKRIGIKSVRLMRDNERVRSSRLGVSSRKNISSSRRNSQKNESGKKKKKAVSSKKKSIHKIRKSAKS